MAGEYLSSAAARRSRALPRRRCMPPRRDMALRRLRAWLEGLGARQSLMQVVVPASDVQWALEQVKAVRS